MNVNGLRGCNIKGPLFSFNCTAKICRFLEPCSALVEVGASREFTRNCMRCDKSVILPVQVSVIMSKTVLLWKLFFGLAYFLFLSSTSLLSQGMASRGHCPIQDRNANLNLQCQKPVP